MRALLLLVAAGCSEDPASQVMVVFDAEPQIRADATEVQVIVGGRSGAETEFRQELDRRVALGDVRFPFRVSLAPKDDDPSRRFRIQGTAFDASGARIARVEATSGYLRGEALQLVLVFEDCCRGMECSAGMTCSSCACRTSDVDPRSLPPYPSDAGVPVGRDGGPDGGVGDTDGDGLDDVVEGRFDMSGPRDSDRDGTPDFQDLDSDDDGLGDAREVAEGTTVTDADSDDDQATDLVEVALMTDPRGRADNPTARGWYAAVAPPDGPAPDSPIIVDHLTSVRDLDVYFLVDTTGSMGAEIDRIKTDLQTGAFGGCTGGIIGAIRCEHATAHFGAGEYADFPVNPYGDAIDVPYANLPGGQITGVLATVQNAVNRLALRAGYDLPESLVPALHAIATGEGLGRFLAASPACPGERRGYPCFRPDSVPLVVIITDAPSHNGPLAAHPYAEATLGFTPPRFIDAVDALNAMDTRIVGISIERPGDTGTAHLNALAIATSSVDIAGSPLVFPIASAAELSASIVGGVRIAAQLQAGARVVDANTTDGVDPVEAFVMAVRARTVMTPAIDCSVGLNVRDRPDFDMDSAPETFSPTPQGERVCWNLDLKANTTVERTGDIQVFEAHFEIVDERLAGLARRSVFFIVPPLIGTP